jgi:spore germination cell wall hydrolase CwlJ-like protein
VPDCVTRTDQAGSRYAVSLLAHFLYAEAEAESVRTREAIAATVANQAKRLLVESAAGGLTAARPALFISCLKDLGAAESSAVRTDDLAFASCLGIARRAVSGALQDPTGGAVRFHELGKRPNWAFGSNPCAWIGSYLFYRDDPTGEPSPEPAIATEEVL